MRLPTRLKRGTSKQIEMINRREENEDQAHLNEISASNVAAEPKAEPWHTEQPSVLI